MNNYPETRRAGGPHRGRWIAVLLAILMVALHACSSSAETTTTTAAEETTTTTEAEETTTTTEAVEAPELIETLRIRHPDNLAFSAPFQLIAESGALDGFVNNIDIDTWATPDVLRALLVNGDSDVTAVPTYVGANLANHGMEVSMAAVVVWGLLWVIGPDGAASDWESLRGQTVMIPYPNDMPDLVFRYLANANGLVPGEDFTIEYYAQPPEVVSRLVAGAGSWAVLPEHVATLALMQAGQNGNALTRVMDLQQEWASVTGLEPRIPQAGIVVPTKLAQERPDLIGAILDALTDSVALVNAASPETVAALSEASGVPAPLVENVIPRLNLEIVPGADARVELERFFTELASMSPDIIGGGLPPAEFYLPDPR